MQDKDVAITEQEYLRWLPMLGKVAAAEKAGVSMTTITNWRADRESFALAEARAYAERLDRIEHCIEEIALGHIDGTSTQVTAAKLMLAANRNKYQQHSTTQLTGPGGGPVMIQQADRDQVEEAVQLIQKRILALPAGSDDKTDNT